MRITKYAGFVETIKEVTGKKEVTRYKQTIRQVSGRLNYITGLQRRVSLSLLRRGPFSSFKTLRSRKSMNFPSQPGKYRCLPC